MFRIATSTASLRPIAQIHAGGCWRALSLRRQLTPRRLASFVPTATDLPTDIDLDQFDVPILDQGQTGGCGGWSTAGALAVARALGGQDPVGLSGAYIYSFTNNGVDQGSSIAADVDVATSNGTCPASRVTANMIYPSMIPAEAAVQASRFRIADALAVTDPRLFAAAIAVARPVICAIEVGADFSTLDGEGVPPVANGPGNHAVTLVGYGLLPSGRFAFRTRNSWSERWGQNGYCYLLMDHLAGADQSESRAIVAAFDDPQDSSLPPVVTASRVIGEREVKGSMRYGPWPPNS